MKIRFCIHKSRFGLIAISSLLMTFVGENRLHAQESADFKLHEIRIGVAVKPFLPAAAFDSGRDAQIKSDGGAVSRDHYTPVLSLSYEYHFRKWFSLASTAGVCSVWRMEKNDSEAPWKEKRGGHFLLSMMPRFTYFDRGNVRLYSGLSVGFMMGNIFSPSAELIPFGVSFGSAVFGFVELGFGTDYNGANFGVGYRF